MAVFWNSSAFLSESPALSRTSYEDDSSAQGLCVCPQGELRDLFMILGMQTFVRLPSI